MRQVANEINTEARWLGRIINLMRSVIVTSLSTPKVAISLSGSVLGRVDGENPLRIPPSRGAAPTLRRGCSTKTERSCAVESNVIALVPMIELN
jgi:hypothetical protein